MADRSSPENYTLWHKVKKHILDPNTTNSNCLVVCAICDDKKLDILGLGAPTTHQLPPAHHSPSPAPTPESYEKETGVLLPCGHMFCKTCWGLYSEPRLNQHPGTNNPLPYRCPTCRFELRFSICGCAIKAVDIPPHDDVAMQSFGKGDHSSPSNFFADVPLTVHETAKKPKHLRVTRICAPCRLVRLDIYFPRMYRAFDAPPDSQSAELREILRPARENRETFLEN